MFSKGSNNVWCLVVSNPPPTLGAGTTCHLCHHTRYTRHILQDDKLQSTSSARVGVASGTYNLRIQHDNTPNHTRRFVQQTMLQTT